MSTSRPNSQVTTTTITRTSQIKKQTYQSQFKVKGKALITGNSVSSRTVLNHS